jgi:hypothetical protein
MRRTHKDGDLDVTAAKQAIRVRRDRPRIHEARVRRDNRDGISRRRRSGLGKVAIDLARKRIWLRRIPRSGDRGATNGDHMAW